MGLHQRGSDWYGDSSADLRAFLQQQRSASDDPIQAVEDAACECGGRAFTLLIDGDFQEVAWICDLCEAQYLFHALQIAEPYEGDPDADSECCDCHCAKQEGSVFEVAVGVTLYHDSDHVDWAYIVCRCVACGRIGHLAQWHRIEIPYPRLFENIRNRVPS